jgi:uncharacterized tellurite resistance protein B-like protein
MDHIDKVDFQKVLFRSAMCVMACDGEIHDSEIKEMEIISQKTPYFDKLDYLEEIQQIIRAFSNDKKKVVAEYFSKLGEIVLSPVQKLQILEIVMRIIHADNRIDSNEIKFLQIVKSKLAVPDAIFFKRFGEVSYLKGIDETGKVNFEQDYLVKKMNLPDFSRIKNKFLKDDIDIDFLSS